MAGGFGHLDRLRSAPNAHAVLASYALKKYAARSSEKSLRFSSIFMVAGPVRPGVGLPLSYAVLRIHKRNRWVSSSDVGEDASQQIRYGTDRTSVVS